MKETENAELQEFISELLSYSNFNQTVETIKTKIDEIVSASILDLEKFEIIDLNFNNKNINKLLSELKGKKTANDIKIHLEKTKEKINGFSESEKKDLLHLFLNKTIEIIKNKKLPKIENTGIKPLFFSKMLLNFTHWFNQSLIYTYIILTLFVILSLVIGGITVWERWADKNKTGQIAKQISEDLEVIYSSKNNTGILKTLIDKFPKQPGTPTLENKKPQTENNAPAEQKLQIDQSVSEGIVSKLKDLLPNDQKIKTLNDVLDELKKFKVEELQKKIEVKLDEAKIKEIFAAVVKDEKSEFGLAMKKIKELGNKGTVKTDDTDSAKTIDGLTKDKADLLKKIAKHKDEIDKEKDSITKLNDTVDKKSKEIDKLENKIKSIGDEKTGFKGPAGSYAILLTNSADFQLPSSLLETVFGVLEKQNGISKEVQKIGMYIATGEDISTRYDLRTKIKPKNPTATEPLTGRPTECIIEVGKSFLKYAFDNGKEPAIPIADRKAIIIATLSAKAPKLDSDGWDKITQVDAILIQTPKDKDFREASDWLDFTHKKNGRLVFVQGFDKFAAGSPSLLQLEKHLLTLLNTKKD